jgi:crotonobetainyl-CoA:carnitine CoA-transferase CaiB-like acyl-CoA transferase
LQGLRVLDFTQAWAGPMTARALAFLGGEVIKIENGARLDSWRGPVVGVNDPASYPDRQGGERPYDRNALFNTQNHDKKSISLDLKSPAGQDLARRLAARCDVVLANFSPHALTKLGLGYEALSQDNPKLVMVEMPAFGNDGPWSSHVGMGKTMEAAAGMASLIGYGDGEPVLTGPAYLDPIGGLHGAAAVLTALAERNRTGLGQYVEVAQVEAAMHWIGEYILQTGRTGEVFQPDGNRRPDMAPHDAFPCAGEDQWIVIACPDDETWRRLPAATGIRDLAHERFADLAGRREHAEAVKEALSAWTRGRNKHEASDLLQAAGVPAAPVNSGADVWRDPFLRGRGFIQELTHPAAGKAEYPGLAYRLSRTPGAIRSPAPCFAEHTHEVLGGLLGLSGAEIVALVEAGVVLQHPVGALAAEPVKAPA